MRPELLVDRLRVLDVEASTPNASMQGWAGLASWRARVRACIVTGLGEHHHLVEKLDDNKFTPGMTVNGGTTTQWNSAWIKGMTRARGYIDAAIYELEMKASNDELVDAASCDPGLWAHVRSLVEAEDWGKVASQAAIFVEDKMRRWAGLDGDTYGSTLFSKVLAPTADLRLGTRAGEYEGWRNLGTGFAQAIGNVERHHINDRADARRYAIGVLGLASLLLTQMRHQHPEATREVDAE